VPMVSIVIL